MAKVIKGYGTSCPSRVLSTSPLNTDHYFLHTRFSTMPFQQSFISVIAVIALATSVSASSIAACRSVSQCPIPLNPYCCGQSIPFNSLLQCPQDVLHGVVSGLDQSKPVGEYPTASTAQGWYRVFPPPFFKKNSHRIKMANPLVPPAKYHSDALASSPPVSISSYSLSQFRACLLTS